jgi:hypothetical protein
MPTEALNASARVATSVWSVAPCGARPRSTALGSGGKTVAYVIRLASGTNGRGRPRHDKGPCARDRLSVVRIGALCRKLSSKARGPGEALLKLSLVNHRLRPPFVEAMAGFDLPDAGRLVPAAGTR